MAGLGLHYGILVLKRMLLHQEKRVKRNPDAMQWANMLIFKELYCIPYCAVKIEMAQSRHNVIALTI